MSDKPLPEVGEIWMLPDTHKLGDKHFLLLEHLEFGSDGDRCWNGLDLASGNMVELALQYGEFWDVWRRVA